MGGSGNSKNDRESREIDQETIDKNLETQNKIYGNYKGGYGNANKDLETQTRIWKRKEGSGNAKQIN